MADMVITAIGPDQPGLVDHLTAPLYQAGVNIVDARMINLRGRFAALLLVEGPTEVLQRLPQELPAAVQRVGLEVSFAQQTAVLPPARGLPYRLKTYSMDRPGIVHQVAHLLHRYNVNIEELESRQESAPFAGGPLFIMQMRLTVPAELSVRQLRRELENLCESLNCDVDLEPL